MKPTSQPLIAQIVTTALQINAQGQWHAFVRYCGHVDILETYLKPADTNYQAQPEEDFPAYETNLAEWKHQTAQEEERDLTEHLNWLRDFLTASPEEAAA
ncbi:hypothetical protein ACIPK7_05450 [Pseudomonas sp. NPDC086581]|uniref:hypothetical protein n=1 Tax=Pseudomonas sp. NPDC086581 TaxID=3364432 RepID=UPI00382782EB